MSLPSPAQRRRATLLDVARAAGVSKTVASRALAGYADVAPATRTRIEAQAQTLGYHASALARALARGRDAPARCAVVNLGMTPAQFGRSLYGATLAGIAAQASLSGVDVHLVTVPAEEMGTPEPLGRLVAEDRADGFIVLTFHPLTPAYVQPFDAARLPYVLINRHFDAQPANCATLDWADAMDRAVQHLTRLGHVRLALLLPDSTTSAVRDREQGWRRGLAGCALRASDAPILRYAEAGQEGGFALTQSLLQQGMPGSGDRPTGLVCFDDYCAQGVLTAARGAGVAVPEHLSVIGCDGVIAPYTCPPLCSFDARPHDLGVAAAELLVATLHGKAGPRRELLPLALQCRASCGPAPGAPGHGVY